MKRIIVLLAFVAVSGIAVRAQVGYNFVYQQKMDLSAQGQMMDSSQVNPEMQSFIMSFLSKMKSFYTLTYANGRSLFAKDMKRSDESFGVAGGSDESVFVDFGSNEQVEVVDFFGRSFNITDTLERLAWQFTNERKQVAGLNCTKAISDDTNHYVVWYSMETPIPAGPMKMYGLPGLVAEATMGPITYTLVEIEVLDKTPDIKRPTKGKKMSRKELNELMKKKMDEMQISNKGRGGIKVLEF